MNFISTPLSSKRSARRIWSDLYRQEDSADVDETVNNQVRIGEIGYSNDTVCSLTTNTEVAAQYEIQFQGMQTVVGLHIPSHRPVASYTSVPHIPTDPRTATQEYQQFQQLLIQFYGGHRSDNPGKIQKQSLISFAVFGEGNSSVTPNLPIMHHYQKFQEVLRNVLPQSLGFKYIEIRMPEVVLVTDSGDFTLDAMSGGINAIFSIAWQIHMFAQDQLDFIVTIDEPETHLHPSMQRTLLPSLAKAFPQAKFIISTHSPFIVSSFPDANVYALVRNDRARVESILLDLRDLSGTPNEVLREILDVGSNLPVWVEEAVGKVIDDTANLPPEEKARAIMTQLERLGIANAIAEYGNRVADAKP
ncbi:AAA family ATPase [Neorhizobium galegae]|uniref:AAA family ATPase n=1 Tax=Neorhizobium galegae TaxID=399 RepID=UPI0006895858|nr:AAA family ATPase [Neorhizobium galegae]